MLLFRFESRKESSNQDHWLHLMSSVIPLRLRTAMLRCSKITELLHSDFPTIHPRSMGIPEACLHKMILQLQIVEIDAKRSHENATSENCLLRCTLLLPKLRNYLFCFHIHFTVCIIHSYTWSSPAVGFSMKPKKRIAKTPKFPFPA